MVLRWEDEPLAEALAIQRRVVADGLRWISARTGELALAGDQACVDRFRLIAAEYDRLLGATIQ